MASDKQLITANALTPTSGTVAFVLGATLGLGIRELFGGGDQGSVALLLFSIGAFVSAGLIARTLQPTALGPTHPLSLALVDTLKGVTADLIDGLKALNSHRVAGRAVVIVAINRISFGVITAGALLLLRNTFHDSVNANAALADFAILTGAAASAALIAAIATPWVTRRIGVSLWSALTVAQAALGMMVFAWGAVGEVFPALVLSAFSLGFAGQAVKVCSDTAIQESIPDDRLGRVFAIFDMSVNISLVSGIVLVALIAPVSGIAPVLYVIVGIGLAVASFWYQATRPKLVL